MKTKTIAILLVSFLSLTILAQTNNSYKTFDGSVFSVNDTITIGTNTGYKTYKSIRVYYYDSKYSNGYKDLNYLLNNQKFPIKKIFLNTEIFNKQKAIVKVGEKGFLKKSYFIDIESAVQNGEVVVKSNNKTELISIVMAEDIAFANYHYLTKKTIKESREEYLFRFRKELYNKTREDEFEYNSALKESGDELQSKVSKIDTSTVYSISGSINFLKYDFDNDGFPLNDKDIKFSLLKSVNSSWQGSKENYNQMFLYFDNFKNFSFLQFPADEAKGFIARRKDSYGNVDRKIYIKIFYKLNGTYIGEKTKDNYLTSDIIKIEVYEFKTFQGNFLGEIYDLTK